MTYQSILDAFASWAAILTFIGAVTAYMLFKVERWNKRRCLEKYLMHQGKRSRSKGLKGQFSPLHLVRHLGLTEDEILQASFRSKRIQRFVGVDDESGLAETLLFSCSD